MDREPAVAGRFYPRERDALASEVAALLGEHPGGRATAEPPRAVIGLLAPHAGYMYSGAVAGATYARVDVPERAVILCPNHTGFGAPVALWPDGAWKTPLGRVPVDPELADALGGCALVVRDHEAHRFEHALEVQLPFLQLRRPEIAIAALCLSHLSYADCEEVARAVARAARARPTLIVASSDMSHYVPVGEARRKDHRALDRLLALDPRGLYDTVRREEISMCGFVPATVMLAAALELGAREAELVRYGSSADAGGDERQVVGYAGAVVY